MYKCFRLTNGMDLKEELEKYAVVNNISGVVISSVGCLKKLTIRLADGKSILEKEENYEIVSITGTLSHDGVHIHISVSDNSICASSIVNGNGIISLANRNIDAKISFIVSSVASI